MTRPPLRWWRHPLVVVTLIVLSLDAIGAIGAGVSVAVLVSSDANHRAITALNTALDREAASQRTAAQLTQQIVAELDYMCELAQEQAQAARLRAPSLPAVCNVVVPTDSTVRGNSYLGPP